jgi:hypothetical protein
MARKARPSELNQFRRIGPARLRKTRNVADGMAALLKRFSVIQMPRRRERNSKMLRGQKKISVSSLASSPLVGKEDGRAGATAMRRQPYQSLF